VIRHTVPFVDRLKTFLPPLILTLLAFCLFANTFSNTWTYDDFPVIVENPDIRSWGAFLKDAYAGRPLREITFMIDYSIFGLNPAGWHIQAIFWHTLNASLLFFLVCRLAGRKSLAWLASLLFLVHPIQAEVVANLSHRKDSLALAFSLAAVLLYADSFHTGRKILYWFLAVVSTFVALLAKQNAAVLPLVFLAYEVAFVPREERFLLKKRYLAYSAIFGATILLFLWFVLHGHESYTRGIALLLKKADFFSPPTYEVYWLLLFKSWAFMLFKLFYPVNLAVEYTYAIPRNLLAPWVLSSILLLFLFLFFLYFSFRKEKTLFFFLAWAGLFWLPTSNLWPLSYFAADRYWYAPSAGIFAVLVLLAGRFVKKDRTLLLQAVPFLLLLAFLCVKQNRVWASPETLWNQAVKVSPTSSFALNNLGNVYLLKGNLFKAREFYLEAATRNPSNPTSYYNLGMVYERTGNREETIKNYRKFLSFNDPTYRETAEELKRHLAQKYDILVK